MTDSEELKELEKQIELLFKKKKELEDTIIKSELSKNRFRIVNYVADIYYCKILSVNENNCDVLEIHIDNHIVDPYVSIKRANESFHWLMSADSITEEEFNQKYNEILNRLKL